MCKQPQVRCMPGSVAVEAAEGPQRAVAGGREARAAPVSSRTRASQRRRSPQRQQPRARSPLPRPRPRPRRTQSSRAPCRAACAAEPTPLLRAQLTRAACFRTRVNRRIRNDRCNHSGVVRPVAFHCSIAGTALNSSTIHVELFVVNVAGSNAARGPGAAVALGAGAGARVWARGGGDGRGGTPARAPAHRPTAAPPPPNTNGLPPRRRTARSDAPGARALARRPQRQEHG
ncbi:Protein of unknown function, partial [Gryllus bimaculatus]